MGMAAKTTVYLPNDLKTALEREAVRLGLSEAEVIRRAIAAAVSHASPQFGLFAAEPFAARVDELLAGFGER
jgi:hypothetical protein